MNPRKTLRIAAWELSKNVGQLDRRTFALVGVVVLAVAVLAPAVASEGVTLDDGIYRVGVAEDSPYYEPVTSDPTFAVAEPSAAALESGSIDLLIRDGKVFVASAKGRAAQSELRSSVERYNDRLLADEDDGIAAFPVNVTLRYVAQTGDAVRGSTGDESVDATSTTGADETSDDGTDGGTGGETGGDGGSGGTAGDGGKAGAPSLGSSLLSGGQRGTPSDIAPPFPFASLVLAFAFVLPMNFVVQAYASSVIAERINYRGELLLVSPVSRFDIIAGKTLPYLLGMVGIAAATAVAIGGGFVAVAAVVPIALVFLSSAFVAAMFARSFKELTFVTVTLSVFLTAYVFVPAIFSNVHPIAAISPLTLVVKELQGTAVPVGEYLFSTLPFYLTAAVLFALGAGVYREEDMFTQRPVHLKMLDALDGQIAGRRSVAKLSAFAVPFVFVGELLSVAVLFVLPVGVSLPILLVVVAFVEEVAKSVHVFAGFAHGRFDRTPAAVVAVGALGGLGFFVGEKLVVITQLVGLPELELGRAAFGVATGAGIEASPVVLVGLLLAPLALHAVTATITAAGASRDRTWYAGTLAVATAVHVAYNLAVVNGLG